MLNPAGLIESTAQQLGIFNEHACKHMVSRCLVGEGWQCQNTRRTTHLWSVMSYDTSSSLRNG